MTTSGTVIATARAERGLHRPSPGNKPTRPPTSTDNTVTWNRATHLGVPCSQPTDTVYRTTITPAVTVAVLDDKRIGRDRELRHLSR